jgi:hypothetical protein
MVKNDGCLQTQHLHSGYNNHFSEFSAFFKTYQQNHATKIRTTEEMVEILEVEPEINCFVFTKVPAFVISVVL